MGIVHPTKEVVEGRGDQSWRGTEGVSRVGRAAQAGECEASSWVPHASNASQKI